MHSTDPGLLVVLEAKPGKQQALAEFLNSGLALAAREAGTRTWYAFRITDSSFGIVDSFRNEDGRQQHLGGPLAEALRKIAAELLLEPPEFREIDILAAKSLR
ncbi:MAG: quinol monooxygenase YgiN [Gammaproteobacteria bacterium]|jgi:quinol monooxygenase YgiN